MKQINQIKFGEHFMFTSSASLRELIQPLAPYGITHLTITIIRKDKVYGSTVEFLSTDPGIMKPFIDERLYEEIHGGDWNQFIDCALLVKTYSKSSENLRNFESIQRMQYGIAYGIDFIKTFNNRTEIFYFASTPDNYAIENFYINNIDLLNQFIFSIREKAARLFLDSYRYN